MYASSLVRSRPKGAGQTCAPDKSDLGEFEDICAEYTHHRGTTVSRDCFALGCNRVGTIIDREITSNCPLGSTYGLGCLIEFGGHIEIMDGWWSTVDTIKTDQRVNLEISKVEVDINRVETDEEVDKDFLLLFRYVFEEGLSPDVARGERCGNTDIEPKGFGVNITNVDTTLMSEENRITLSVRVDAYVELSVWGVRKEWFQDEVI
jgi:hypothetical protein